MIIKPFNKLFNTLIILAFVFVIAMGYIARKISLDLAINILLVFQFITLIYFYYYKIALLYDKEYAEICDEHSFERSCFWNEMFPFHLCNMGIIFIPIALLTRNQNLLCFCCFVFPFSTSMALIMPSTGFENHRFTIPRVAGFYLTHLAIFASSLSIWAIGIYTPDYSQLIPLTILWFSIELFSFIVNSLIKRFTSCKQINYLFTMGPQDNFVLEFFYKLIPVPLLYHLPTTAIYMSFVVLLMFVLKNTIYK